VAETSGHHREVLARVEHERRVGVPQIVEALSRQPEPPKGSLKLVSDVPPVERRPYGRREHVVRVPPSPAGGETGCELSAALFSSAEAWARAYTALKDTMAHASIRGHSRTLCHQKAQARAGPGQRSTAATIASLSRSGPNVRHAAGAKVDPNRDPRGAAA
jgi:hypothetical protein